MWIWSYKAEHLHKPWLKKNKKSILNAKSTLEINLPVSYIKPGSTTTFIQVFALLLECPILLMEGICPEEV